MLDLNLTYQKLHEAQISYNKENEVLILYDLAFYYYTEEKNLEKSIFLLKSILEIKNYLNVYYFLALIEIEKDNLELARKYLEKELNLFPNNKEAKIVLNKLKINSNFPYVTIILFFLNLFSFIFIFPQINFPNLLKFSLNFGGDFFNIFISIFFHSNLIHFSVNIFILLLFGLLLEKNLGSILFLIIYLFAGFFGNLVQSFFNPDAFVLGASGALYGLFGALLMKEPLMNIKIFFLIKIPMILFFSSFFFLSIFLENLFLESNISSAFISHLIGFLIGILIIGIFYNETIEVFYNWIIIFLGFWIIKFSVENFFLNLNLFAFIYLLLLIFLAIILISYSYIQLKKFKELNLNETNL